MPKTTRTMDDARELLFDAAEKLKNASAADLDTEILRSKGMAALVGVIVESAKVEVAHSRASNQPSTSGFLPVAPARPELPEGKPAPRLVGDGKR